MAVSRSVLLGALMSTVLTVGCGSTVQFQSARGASVNRDGLGAPGTAPTGDQAPAGGSGAGQPLNPAFTAAGGDSATAEPGEALVGPGPTSPRVGAAAPAAEANPTRTGPVKVGILYFDSQANEALGDTNGSLRPGPAAKALVAGLNKRGGLNGRRIQPVYYVVDSTASNYSVVATEACTFFTQDKSVSVVLDYGFGMLNGFAACLARRGVADIGLQAADDIATSEAALFATAASMSTDRRYRNVVTTLAGTGYLARASKVGVILEDCPESSRAYKRTVLPALSSVVAAPPVLERLSCTTGFASAGEAARSLQGAVLRFHSANVDRVLIVSDYEQVVLLLFAPQAESQAYRPGYMLSSKAELSANRASLPRGQWPQLTGVGNAPQADVDDAGVAPTAVEARCAALLRQGGVVVGGWRDKSIAYLVCSSAFLLEAALVRNGGDERGLQLMAGVRALGTSFDAPGLVEGATRFGAHRHDGPSAVRRFGWSPPCSCVRYTGSAVPAG